MPPRPAKALSENFVFNEAPFVMALSMCGSRFMRLKSRTPVTFSLAVAQTGMLALLPMLVPSDAAFAQTPMQVASPVSLVVSNREVGRTPRRIGYVMGDNFPGSNVSSWLRYSQPECARFWWPLSIWPEMPKPWKGGNDVAHFESQRTVFRRDIASAIDWKAYGKRVTSAYGQKPAGTIGDSYALSELRKLGTDLLVVLSCPRDQIPFDTAQGTPDWKSRWAYWRGVYTNAFYLARTYDVERFQLFNEPDHSESLTLEQDDFIRRLQIGSDAVQAAITDVNRLYQKSLKPQISAPVTAGLLVFEPRTGRKDKRDAKVGWGELAMRMRNADFPGRGDYNQGLFGVYAFQSYTRNPGSITERLPQLRSLIAEHNKGQELPVIASEMNVSTAADFSKTTDTLDTPRYYAAFGATAAAYANHGLSESYIFRLTQTNNMTNGSIKKNGVYVIDNSDPLKNIRYGTKSSEAARFFMRGFGNGRIRFETPKTPADSYALAARDEASGAYTLMVSNLATARPFHLDLSSWKLPAQSLVVAEEINEAHSGDIERISSLPPDGHLQVPMPENSVLLLTVRPNVSSTPQVVPLQIEANRFETSSTAQSIPAKSRVVLALRGKIVSPGSVQMRVYGGSGPLSGQEILGHFVVSPERTEYLLDVTRYIAGEAPGIRTLRVEPVMPTAQSQPFQTQSAELLIFPPQ